LKIELQNVDQILRKEQQKFNSIYV
jgi:hypothetical protein